MSTQILRLCGKDKKFRKWLAANRLDIRHSNYYVSSIISAYKTSKPIYEIDNFAKRKIKLDHADKMDNVKALVKKEVGKFLDYIERQNTNFYSYRDYLDACQYLGLDMDEEKNRYPHNFKRWHDIRIDEYRSAKALKDEQERKEFYEKFAAVASKYLGLEYDKKSGYIAIIAQKPSDLTREGELRGTYGLRPKVCSRRNAYILYPNKGRTRKTACNGWILFEKQKGASMLRRPRQQTKRKRNGIRKQEVAALRKQKTKTNSGVTAKEIILWQIISE